MTGGTTADDLRKSVCKSFTGVVKSSALAVDPKAFFMMLNANYAVLCQGGRMDLAPLWDAMASRHPAEQLHGVFLMFRMRAMDLGLKVVLPDAVDGLSEDEMRLAMRPYTGMMIPDEPTPYEPIELPALPLSTGDLQPFVSEDLRRRIVQVVSTAIRNSPVGAKIDAAQLTFQIDSGFDSLFDGRSFDFAQIFDVLRQSHPLEDEDIYIAIARSRVELDAMNVGIIEPSLALDSYQKQNISDDIRRADERAAKERASSFGSQPDKPRSIEKAPEETSKRITRDEKLKEYGLNSVSEKKRRVPIRALVLGALLVPAALAAFLTRPNRNLAHESYDAVMPMKSAELVDNTFQCVVDDARWFELDPEEREKRLSKFQAMLKDEGLVPNMQCRDTYRRLVISAAGSSRLVGAAFFMKGDASGTIPKKDPVADKKE